MHALPIIKQYQSPILLTIIIRRPVVRRAKMREETGVTRASFLVATIAAMALCLGAGSGAAAGYPERPVRLIVSFPPGGSSDAMARIVQPGVEKQLGQSIVIENRPGAGGMIAVDVVAKSAADGYVIGLGGAGALGTNLGLQEKMSYDPQKDIAPVTGLAASPFILAASPSLAARSLRDVIALAKSSGETLAIGHGGNGTLMHLTAEMFNQMADTRILHSSIWR
jgi:tripartite-type tricarboxylate transporter receptor subunit TctC